MSDIQVIKATKIATTDSGHILLLSNTNKEWKGMLFNGFDAFDKYVKVFESVPKADGIVEFKIGNRLCQSADYGKHLRTMYKRAKSLSAYIKEDFLEAFIVQGYQVKDNSGATNGGNWFVLDEQGFNVLKQSPNFKDFCCHYNIISAKTVDEIINMMLNYKFLVRFRMA